MLDMEIEHPVSPNEKETPISAWFAGPKAENSDIFARTIRRILEDHQYWRRNYFPEDGVVIPPKSATVTAPGTTCSRINSWNCWRR